ncbi:hypothetical protein Pcinc_041430 [Petrolisthes cinctipes]|uniref:Major facilitator superfamily (MFS) profile domain-containing protein n=1 Tax=Petrolisthes cinctipes TaxID=88211 RepID=A0AAE1BJV8_PETCI|nr:hypothetical protein Pcinc_041430 [Petrolisthes cinctipes]
MVSQITEGSSSSTASMKAVESVAICIDAQHKREDQDDFPRDAHQLLEVETKGDDTRITKRANDTTQLTHPNSPQPDTSLHPPPPPNIKDRGYAWVVVLVVFLVNTIVTGYVKSFGLLYVLVLDYFPDASGATAGWIIGLLVGCRGLMTPVMGAMTIMFGPRRCVVAGGLLMCVGLIAATQTFSIYYMAFTLGSLVGVGIGMSETPGYILVTDYFLERRSLANGLRASGNSMGGIIFSPLVVFLCDWFGLQGAFIIMAGIMLQVVILGMLMRPFAEHSLFIQQEYKRKMKEEHGFIIPADTNNTPGQLNSNKKEEDRKPLELSFLVTPSYLVYLAMVLFTALALPSALVYIPVHGRSVGLSKYENSVITAYVSGSDFVLTLLMGWFSDKNYVKKAHTFVAGLMLGGVGCMLIPLCTKMWLLMAVSTLMSLAMATYFTLINVLLADQFGGNSMASTWGFLRFTTGMCNLFYPSLIGMVLDVTGSTLMMYLLMGGGLIVGSLIISFQPLVTRLTNK